MRKYILLFLTTSLILTACSDEDKISAPVPKETAIVTPKSQSKPIEYPTPTKNEEEEKESTPTDEANGIDTSVFKNAKIVDVTDARDITNHITLKIDLNEGTEVGMGTLNVLKRTYDFLEQEDIEGAETVSILIRANNVKVSQFKIYTSKFHPNDEIPMATLVLQASDIEFLSPEVKAFGEVMELW